MLEDEKLQSNEEENEARIPLQIIPDDEAILSNN